jgi:hypothetical protein
LFSRENLKVVKRAIAHGECFPNPPHVQSFQRNEYGISRHRTSAFLLKGNFERGEKDDDSEYSLTSPFSREIYEHG